jgi:energy-coupling factor transporter ATP-binding protein EcfA2
LIDEPELHLHPALQSRMLDYLRSIVSRGGVQFIITTHSSNLLNATTEAELYLLMPQSELIESANQLLQADNAERLEGVRMLCGETYPITACRTILCLEGELPEDLPKKPTDKKILETLCLRLRDMVIIPMGGKNEVLE